MTSGTGLFAAYPGTPGDEAVGPGGLLAPGWAALAPVLSRIGTDGLAAAAAQLTEERRRRGAVRTGWADGRRAELLGGLDPVPRVLDPGEWTLLRAGVVQRVRAFNAFLTDVYRPAGRRRTDPDRDPEGVRAGVLPAEVVAASPGHDPAAVGLAWRGQPRAGLAAVDLRRTPDGEWVVLGDDLRAPSGLVHAVADRVCVRAVLPELSTAGEPADPHDAVEALRAALVEAAPPGCDGEPRLAVLADGDDAEARLLATALGVPLARPADLWPAAEGGVAVLAGGERLRVDVLHRRLDEHELAAHGTPAGCPLDVLLADAVRHRTLTVTPAPGNGVADGETTAPYVADMVRFYLGEEPLLRTARTLVLADPRQEAEARDRLGELELTAVDGYGGGGVVSGPGCSSGELALLAAEVAAAPHRFVAREPVPSSTVPALVDGLLAPAAADLRVFVATGRTATVLPAALSRVLATGADKDTWLPA